MIQEPLPFDLPRGKLPPLPFPLPRRVKLPSWQFNPEPIMRPADSYPLKSREPGPYGVGPVIDIPRESLSSLRHMERHEFEMLTAWARNGNP